ncbi:MAG: 50S ribosomal protein L21e [Nanoarchaeota archaeon]
MTRRTKKVKEKGKIRFSEYFKKLKEGDKVAIVRELSVSASFPQNIQGRTGVVEERRGRAYIVKINDYNQEKRFIIEPIHLKKIKTI